MSANPSGKGTSVLSRRHSIDLMLTEADLHLEMPTSPWGTAGAEVTFLGCTHFGRLGAPKPIWTLFLSTFFSLQDCFHSRSCKAGTIYRDLPLAEHTCKEDGEQGMPEGRVRGAKGTITFISRGMGDEKGRK